MSEERVVEPVSPRPDPGRLRRGRQHQTRRLGYVLARDSGTQPDLHHRAGGKRVRQLCREDFSHISRAGQRIEQVPEVFGCLLLALGLGAAPRLFGALDTGLDVVLPLAAVALGHDHPSVPTGTG